MLFPWSAELKFVLEPSNLCQVQAAGLRQANSKVIQQCPQAFVVPHIVCYGSLTCCIMPDVAAAAALRLLHLVVAQRTSRSTWTLVSWLCG